MSEFVYPEARCDRAVPRPLKPDAAPGIGRRPPMLLALCLVLVWCARSAALEELEVVELVADIQFAQPVFTDDTFDQWVFQHHRTAAKARTHMKSQLALQVQNIDRSCELTDAQTQKLQLAGRGDVKRFFDSYEVVKKKFQLLKHDQQKVNQIWQDISPLQMTMRSGLFHDGSFMHKSLRNTLTDEQFAHYARNAREARMFRYRAKVELSVGVFEQGMPLTDEQRRKLVAILLKETKPPRKSGQYDHYFISYQISRMPKEKLRPLLDDTQWKVLNRMLDQGRQMEQWLRQQGYLDDDEDAEADADEVLGN